MTELSPLLEQHADLNRRVGHIAASFSTLAGDDSESASIVQAGLQRRYDDLAAQVTQTARHIEAAYQVATVDDVVDASVVETGPENLPTESGQRIRIHSADDLILQGDPFEARLDDNGEWRRFSGFLWPLNEEDRETLPASWIHEWEPA